MEEKLLQEHAPQSEELGRGVARLVAFTPLQQVKSTNTAKPYTMGNQHQQLYFTDDRKKKIDQKTANPNVRFLPPALPKNLRYEIEDHGNTEVTRARLEEARSCTQDWTTSSQHHGNSSYDASRNEFKHKRASFYYDDAQYATSSRDSPRTDVRGVYTSTGNTGLQATGVSKGDKR